MRDYLGLITEAPVYGSMLLAAILLKLGGHDLIRLRMILMRGCLNYSYFLIRLGVIGRLYVMLYIV